MLRFTLSGFAIAMIVIAMMAVTIATFTADMKSAYNISGNETIGKYNSSIYDDIKSQTEDIRDATDIAQEDSWLDVIGGYFSAGYSALKTSILSFGWFESLMDQAAEDVPEFSLFKTFLIYAVIMGIFVGVVIAVLVKMRI